MLNICKIFKIVKKIKGNIIQQEQICQHFLYLKIYVALQGGVGQSPLLVGLGGEASAETRVDDD